LEERFLFQDLCWNNIATYGDAQLLEQKEDIEKEIGASPK